MSGSHESTNPKTVIDRRSLLKRVGVSIAVAGALLPGFSAVAYAQSLARGADTGSSSGGGGHLPTDRSQCQSGGWQNYGGTFKNQGDCVSYVETQGKNAPDGN